MPKLSETAWAAVRADYETTLRPTREIAASVGISHVTLWKRAKRDGWLRPYEDPALPVGAADEKLLARLFRAFERQIGELEQRFLAGGGSVEEKDARTLSVLARTFETLGKLRDGREGEADDAPVDLDALRGRIAQRLAQIEREGLSDGPGPGADPGGDGAG